MEELQTQTCAPERIAGCRLLYLIWSDEPRSAFGHIGWAEGERRSRIIISWDELERAMKTGVIMHQREGVQTLSELAPSDHGKLAQVFRLLLATLQDNAKIGIRAFSGTWTFSQL